MSLRQIVASSAQRIVRNGHAVRHAAQTDLGHALTTGNLPFGQVQVLHRLVIQPGVIKGGNIHVLSFQRGRFCIGQALCGSSSIRTGGGGR